MGYRGQVSVGMLVAAIMALASSRGVADDQKLPAMDRLAATGLLLVSMAWSFERSCGLSSEECGLSSEEDEALLTRYLSSDDLKRRDKQVADAFPKGGGVIAGAIAKNSSACRTMRETIEKGTQTGRPILEYYLTHSAAEIQELDRRGAQD